MERDTVAVKLIRDFVNDKLGGDINNLRTYNLKTLADEPKYGENFFARSPVVKAIMSLSFGDIWPELSFDTITRGRFECDCINMYQNLFGINMCDQYFKGLQKYNPTEAQQQRALKVAHMSYSIGNLWVLPSSPSIASRILDNSYRYYMDKFLLSIYNVLTEKKRCDKTLQSIIAKHKMMDVYKGEKGFDQFVKDMMLEDFLDYYRKPTEIFPFVWCSMKDLSKDVYFDAVEQYCTFCEKFTPKRADRIINKLSMVLAEASTARKATTRPITTTVRPEANIEESRENNNVLNRYTLAYQFIPMSLDFALEDKAVRLPLLAEKDYHITLARKLGLQIEGFSWSDFSVEVKDTGVGVVFIFFTFPKPLKEPEALYGAIMIDQITDDVSYYTLEKCSHSGRWALGKNSSEHHDLMGMFDIEPTKENFINIIISNRKQPESIDVKALLNLPENFKVLDKMPEDPYDSVSYGTATPMCKAFIQAFPISISKAMDFDDIKPIIDGIHHTLSDSQALIEVKNGKTTGGRLYVYSIIKNKMESSGVGYFLLLHVAHDNVAISINGHFIESGTTGIRDATVFELATRKGLVSTTSQDKWWFDPYDKDFKHSFLMNLSEQEHLDEYFPDHPLSQCRLFIKLITQKL